MTRCWWGLTAGRYPHPRQAKPRPTFRGKTRLLHRPNRAGLGSARGQNIRGLSSPPETCSKFKHRLRHTNTPHLVGGGRSVVNRRLRRHPHSGRGDLPGAARTLESRQSNTSPASVTVDQPHQATAVRSRSASGAARRVGLSATGCRQFLRPPRTRRSTPPPTGAPPTVPSRPQSRPWCS